MTSNYFVKPQFKADNNTYLGKSMRETMITEFIDDVIRKYDNPNIETQKFITRFVYPKLVVIGEKHVFVIDIESNHNVEQYSGDCVHETKARILDVFLQQQLLWILAEPHELVIFDLISGNLIPIRIDNSHDFKQFKTNGEKLYLVTESDEYLQVSCSVSDILAKAQNEEKELKIHLEKINIRIDLHAQYYYDCLSPIDNPSNLELIIKQDLILLKCPVTGLTDEPAIPKAVKWKHAVPWGEMMVLSDGTSMWITNLNNAHVQLQLNADNVSYLPLAHWKDSFYYLVSLTNEVQIHHIHKTSVEDEHEVLPITSDNVQKARLEASLKEQLHQLVDKIISTSLLYSDTIQKLKVYFNEIDDKNYLIEKGIDLCHHDINYKVLLDSLHIKVQDDEALTKQICDVIYRIEILQYISLLENNNYDKMQIFQSNVAELCIMFVSNSDLDLASMVWVKLFRMQSMISPESINAILTATPLNIKMNAFIVWLKNFIPPLLDKNPFHIDLFVKWTTDRIFSLEKSSYWPKIGIKFIQEILLVLETSQRKYIMIRPTSVDGLDTLKVHISKIFDLKEKYKINMLLGELSSLSTVEVALIMLQRCYTEDLEDFLHNYMSAFAAESYLELDNILKTHIEREACDNGGGADETRLRIILNAFHTSTSKLECLLEVLRILDVPWNTAMYQLAVTYATVKDSDFALCDTDLQLIHKIKMEINYANLKVVLKKYNFPLNTNDYLLVMHKVVNAPVVDLNDLNVVAKVMKGYKKYASLLYIERCLRDSSVKSALNYFKTLSDVEQKVLLKALVIKYEFTINEVFNDSAIERSFLDFFKGTHILDKITMSRITDMYHLKYSYNINMNLNEMSCENERKNKVDNWFVNSSERASTGRGACVARLARVPQTFLSTLIDLLSETSVNAQVQSLVESLIILFARDDPKKIELILANFKDSKNTPVLWSCCKVLVHLIFNCLEDYLYLLNRVLLILGAIANTSIIDKHLTVAWKFHYIFVPMSNITSTDYLIKFYINIMCQDNMNQEIISNITVNNDFVPFRMLANSAFTYIAMNVYQDNLHNVAKEKFAKKMITNILLSPECDELLLAASLILLSSTFECELSEKAEWIFRSLEGYGESVSNSISKYLSSPVMRRALGLESNPNINSGTNALHHILATKFNLNFADLALSDITEDTWDAKMVLFHVLKNYPTTCSQRLLDYCLTLNVDIDDGLSLQLIAKLVDWELKYKLHSDDFKYSYVVCENSEDDLITECSVIWDSIKNKSFLIDVLKDFWKKGDVSLHGRLVSVNPYYYEIYLCIFKLTRADWISRREYFILHFLKDYKRVSSPKQYEFESFSVKGMFPEIGHYRLPFQLFMREDTWSNLKSEITLSTYEQWLPVVTLLSLDPDLQIARDMLCSNALKQTMTARKRYIEVKSSEKMNEPWRLEATEEPLIRAAHRCVRHIANMEWAGACLFYVLQGCARGADQVSAAQLCYHFAQRWAALQSGNRAVRQMQKLHTTLSTRHALHKIDWACEDLLQYSSEPNQLVRALYFHPDFITKMTRYNVNRTVDEIADKNNINMSSIRIQILENILEQRGNEKRDNEIIGLNNDDLMRAKYILKATCPKMGAMYLARIALEDETEFNKKKKLRALQCLISIVEPETSLRVTNKEREYLWEGLVDLLFTIRLEKVDMPWAVATFTRDKLRTIEQVCAASENAVESLQLAAELTVRYGSEKNTRTLIPRLLTTSLQDVLSILLCQTYTYPDKVIERAWKKILLTPFQNADYPVTERQRLNCLQSINLLPLCPCVSEDDLNVIWKNCFRMKCYAMACLVLPFMSVEARQSLSELKKIDKRNLIAGVKNLQTETYLINGALSVIEKTVARKYR